MPTTLYACLIGLFIMMLVTSGLIMATLAMSARISRREDKETCDEARHQARDL